MFSTPYIAWKTLSSAVLTLIILPVAYYWSARLWARFVPRSRARQM